LSLFTGALLTASTQDPGKARSPLELHSAHTDGGGKAPERAVPGPFS